MDIPCFYISNFWFYVLFYVDVYESSKFSETAYSISFKVLGHLQGGRVVVGA